MASTLIRRLALLFVCTQLGAQWLTAEAVPLTTDGAGPRHARAGVTDAEVLDGAPSTADPVQIRPSGDPFQPPPILRGPNASGGLGSPQEIGSIAQDGVSSNLADVFRPLVNLNARAGEPGAGTPTSPARSNGPDIILSGTGIHDLVEEAVRGIVSSAVELRVDDQGRAAFSVLGMGDFGVMVSGDRNEVALVSGADVLFTVNRNPYPHAPGYRAAGYDDGTPGMTPASRPAAAHGESPLHQVMELLSEIATHPLSLLVYAIVGGYALLWSILSVQKSTRPQDPSSFKNAGPSPRLGRASGRRRSRRSRRL